MVKIGTDVYLSWNGMKKKDKDKQMTGFSIKAGNVGYLRASIGMVEENKVLRAIFPEKFWTGRTLLYDFVKNQEGIIKVLKNYIEGNSIDVGGREKKQIEFGAQIAAMFGANLDNAAINRLEWAKSVAGFCELGFYLQTVGKKPKVGISW